MHAAVKHVVLYMENLFPSQERLLRRAFGPDCRWTSILPLVSAPLRTEAEVESMLDPLRTLVSTTHPGQGAVFVQPEETELPARDRDSVLRAVFADASWGDLLRGSCVRPGVLKIDTWEHPRCWLITATHPEGGIPPGMGFIVDRDSMSVMPRRWIDVVSIHGESLA